MKVEWERLDWSLIPDPRSVEPFPDLIEFFHIEIVQ
jgi:hypothetical protein